MAKRKKARKSIRRRRGLGGTASEHSRAWTASNQKVSTLSERLHAHAGRNDCEAAFDDYEELMIELGRASAHAKEAGIRGEVKVEDTKVYRRANLLFHDVCATAPARRARR